MIRKAVITAAGKGTRQYPATNAVQKELFPLVDRDGIAKPTIQIILEEVTAAGVQEIAVIVQPGEERQFKQHFTGLSPVEQSAFRNKPWGLEQSAGLEQMRRAITYLHQTEQRGFGHAVHCAAQWAAGEPVLLLLGDHVYLSEENRSCVRQVLEVYERSGRSVLAVQRTPIEQLHLFGVVAGEPLSDGRSYRLDRIIEKPSVDQARRQLAVAGLPADQFLAIFGIYLLTPAIFDILAENIRLDRREGGEIQLTTALAELIAREGAVGYEVAGRRLDMGTPLGYLQTQLALGLVGPWASELRKYCDDLLSPSLGIR